MGHRRRNVFLLLGAGLTIAVAAGFFLLPRVAARKVEKSIAVLPFQNFSDDKSNAFFADGIQDDILTALSRIRRPQGDLAHLGDGLSQFLEKRSRDRQGARRVGDSRRQRAQRRQTDAGERAADQRRERSAHLGERIRPGADGRLRDPELDSRTKIADALQAHLSPSEEARMTRSPTENGEAYLAFVQARDLHGSLEDRASWSRRSSSISARSSSIRILRSRRRVFRCCRAGFTTP